MVSRIDIPIGRDRLAAVVTQPQSHPRAVAVVSHGFEGSKDSPKWTLTGHELARAGFACVRFDHRGIGGSSGDFANTTLTRRIEELKTAAAWSANRFPKCPLFLIGSSFGGLTCLFAASEVFPVAVALLATPAGFDFATTASRTIEPSGLVRIGTAEVRGGFFSDLESYDALDQAARVSGAIVIHGTDDELIPPHDALEIYLHLQSPRKILFVDGADHPFSDEKHQRVFIGRTMEWFLERL